jgi:hypothetical protein
MRDYLYFSRLLARIDGKITYCGEVSEDLLVVNALVTSAGEGSSLMHSDGNEGLNHAHCGTQPANLLKSIRIKF